MLSHPVKVILDFVMHLRSVICLRNEVSVRFLIHQELWLTKKLPWQRLSTPEFLAHSWAKV
jgi:hypothetical protein